MIQQRLPKDQFVKAMKRKYEGFTRQFRSLKHQVGSADEAIETTPEKMARLEDRVNELGWRMRSFASGKTPLDEVVEKAFKDLVDEINWRLKEVEAALRGKEIWESVAASRRGKKALREVM
jgi:archaellum component FlaC